MYPVATVVASWSLTQEVAGSNIFFAKFTELIEKIQEKLQCHALCNKQVLTRFVL